MEFPILQPGKRGKGFQTRNIGKTKSEFPPPTLKLLMKRPEQWLSSSCLGPGFLGRDEAQTLKTGRSPELGHCLKSLLLPASSASGSGAWLRTSDDILDANWTLSCCSTYSAHLLSSLGSLQKNKDSDSIRHD